MLWFENLMGFKEENPDQVRQNILIDGKFIESNVNSRKYQFGSLEILTLSELRKKSTLSQSSQIQISEKVGDVKEFHVLEENKNALFQAASQFNLLEMVDPEITPEYGIGKYEYDRTQGPACAIACGAGTIYRNYFVKIGDQIGQSSSKQIDCLDEIGQYFDNSDQQLWEMKNGYALVNREGLQKISKTITNLNSEEYEHLKGLLKVGIQWETEVTIDQNKQLVSQIYCSALPVGYSIIDQDLWEHFAKLILDATYEATFHTAMINQNTYGCNKLFLTLVGGGVFGNKADWLIETISNNLHKFRYEPLDVQFISYGEKSPIVELIIDEFKNQVTSRNIG